MAKDRGTRVQTDNGEESIAIKVEHVSKTFRLPHNRQNSLKGTLINLAKGGVRSYEKQEVLKDISFEIKKGEFFGIVGRNGSGKSTMLKMLAGIYKPTKGNITVNGSLTPFIELGVGFSPELTGRENVYLNGALLGFSNNEVESMYDDIVAFAELERFMDQKLKNYSSGMQVRLAFSIAIRAKSDILLLDEVLAVGDEAFQRKCYSYFATLIRNKKTVILVTHDMSAVEKFCSKGIFIDEGKIVLEGSSHEIAAAYSARNEESYVPTRIGANDEQHIETYDLKINLKDADGKKKAKFVCGERMIVDLTWDNPFVRSASVSIVSERGVTVFGAGTYQDEFKIAKNNHVSFAVKLNVQEGNYFLQVGLGEENKPRPVVFVENGPFFAVKKKPDVPLWDGITKLDHSWGQ